MKVVPFEAAHLAGIIADNPDAQMAKVYLNEKGCLDIIERRCLHNAYTAMDRDNKPIAAAGIIDAGNGYGVGWAYIGDCKGRVVWLGKMIRLILADTVKVMNLKVVDILVLKNFPQGRRFAEFLGFTIRHEREHYYLATREF